MTYTVYVASDVFGRKTNLELVFPSAPTLGELTKNVEHAFSAEQSSQRSGYQVPYQVSKFHVVDEVTDDWVEVVSAQQLRNFCQLYSFQPHSTRYTESQGHIPPAKKGVMSFDAYGSNYGSYSPGARSAGGYGMKSQTGFASLPMAAGHVLPDNVGHDEKVRITFEEIDSNKNRVIEMDEMTKTFRVCGLEFTSATLDDLFKKADHDKDNVVSWAEWQRFCELYPALLDSLYYRLKAHWEHLSESGRIDSFKSQRSMLEDRERQAQALLDQLQRDLDDLLRRQGDADGGVGGAQDAQRAAEEAAREAALQAERARQTRADRDRELQAEKERERQANLRAAESQRELDEANRRAAAAQQGVDAAEAAERRAMEALEAARRDKDRHQAIADQARADSIAAKERHDRILGDIPRTLDNARAMLADAERELADADRRQRELAAAAHAAAQKVADAARARDELARALAAARERQGPAERALQDAKNAIVEHDRQVQDLLDKLASEDARKKALLDEEKSIVEQEVRLREQRESLEEKEDALRNAHSNFFHAAGRQSPGRSRSPRYNQTSTMRW